jgi:hypothetical protein
MFTLADNLSNIMEILMNKRLLVFLIFTAFLLAACSSSAGTPASEAPSLPDESRPTETAAQKPTVEELPTATPADETTEVESKGSISASGTKMECTLVSDQPDVPAEYAAIFGVTEDDWVLGPDTAALTIVEYGDFQ